MQSGTKNTTSRGDNMILAINCNDPALANFFMIAKNILNLIRIIGPIVFLVALIIHLVHLLQDPEDKKLPKKIRNTLIATVLLFFIPTIVFALVGMIDENSSIGSCLNNNVNISREVTYQEIETGKGKKSNVVANPNDYEKGVTKPKTEPDTTSTYTGGSLVKEEKTDTLSVSIYKSNSYYVTKIWVKDAYKQLNKYDSPNYGSTLTRPGVLMAYAAQQNGLKNKLMVGFNASGFYLRDTYDSQSVNTYSGYDKTSVGSLVITDGKVVRNAYKYAVKTWYITGVDQSNRMRIFEDAKNSDVNSKKQWSESIIGTVRNTFTFASPLVINGAASDITTSMPSPTSALNRQAFCQINENNFALITGSNLTRDNLINIMLSLECQTGTNFDGGGSIALLFKSKNSDSIETIIGNNRALTEVGYFSE